MDAYKFLKELNRICTKYGKNIIGCKNCPMNKAEYCSLCIQELTEDAILEAIEIVDNWSKENPIFTNKDMFEQTFGMKVTDNENVRHLVVAEDGHIFHFLNPKWWNEEYNKGLTE